MTFSSPFSVSKAGEFVHAAMNARAVRQDIISSNIANVDTPHYRSRDVDFETVLKAEANKAFGVKEPKLEIAKTASGHLGLEDEVGAAKPSIFFRDGHMVRNDGNSVDLDIEMSEMSKNSMMYNALVSAYKKNSAIFSSVIDSSKGL